MRAWLWPFVLACAAWGAGEQGIEKRYREQNQAVHRASERHEYDKAAALLREMRQDREFQSLYELRLNTEYNLACINALAGRKGEALDALESAVKLGLNSYEHVRRDTDLESIRAEARYQPSCGSTGQPLSIGLPGGGGARICTRNRRYADGREFNGAGVQPQVRVSPTVADLRAGRDTVLEAALERLRRQ